MRALSLACEAIGKTSKKTEKVRLLADYFKERSLDEAAISAVFLSGRAFPAIEETTLDVGGTMLWKAVASLAPGGEVAASLAYRKYGDLGAAAEEALLGSAAEESTLSVIDVEAALRTIANTKGPVGKAELILELIAKATAVEAKYIVKIITSDLRIGLKESLVEEAIAKAYGAKVAGVQRANMLLGDIGTALRLAAANRIEDAKMRLFNPIGFMLASPAETADEAWESFEEARIEDKFDGIRAQVHCGGEGATRRVKIFSRTLDEVTGSFPELIEPLAELPGDSIVDGEIVAYDASHGRVLPFSELQKRLGRKSVTKAMMQAVPVAYVAFDVLYAGGDLTIDKPLKEREAILNALFAGRSAENRPKAPKPREREPQGQLALPLFAPKVSEPAAHKEGCVLRAEVRRAESTAGLSALFEQARARGNEGLMIKDVQSVYTPGRRGKSWLKLKQELATLDVVVTAVEFGHGKRAKVLSDYTFSVRDGDRLLTIGKAYSGLTDVEIAEMTTWFLEHTIEDQGHRRVVEPKVVIEVAFNNMMRSSRHESGFALRFPRIVRLRPDKSVEEIDTLDVVEEIFEKQKV